jgi:hypothetical protein
MLHGPADSVGSEALRADLHSPRFSSAHIHLDASQIYEPAPPRMAVRVAYGVASGRSPAAAITKLGHFTHPPHEPVHKNNLIILSQEPLSVNSIGLSHTAVS